MEVSSLGRMSLVLQTIVLKIAASKFVLRRVQVKALALGAKGVGLGRSFLYANACYGEEGVQKIYESESNRLSEHALCSYFLRWLKLCQ
jgi:hypothetical protein